MTKRKVDEDWHAFHSRHLKSTYWQKMRQKVLKAWGYKCGVNDDLGPYCQGPIDVHHRTYQRLGNEDFFDLIPLCRRHHEMFHDGGEVKVKKTKKGVFGWL